MLDKWLVYVIACAFAGVAYFLGALALSHRKQKDFTFNLVAITADPHGRASLSEAQVLFFTLVVIWVVVFGFLLDLNVILAAKAELDKATAVRDGLKVALTSVDYINAQKLLDAAGKNYQDAKGFIAVQDLGKDVLQLLAVAAIGTGTAKFTDGARKSPLGENKAWLVNKGWIQRDLEKASITRKPAWSDLVTSDQGFEVARFQAVVFSIIIAISLIYAGIQGDVGNFSIPDAYLEILMLSQFVYVGGKAVSRESITEINTSITKLRGLELAFQNAVSKAWQVDPTLARNLASAKAVSVVEYNTFLAASKEAAGMVSERADVVIAPDCFEPELPS